MLRSVNSNVYKRKIDISEERSTAEVSVSYALFNGNVYVSLVFNNLV